MESTLLPNTPQILHRIEEELRLNQDAAQRKETLRELKQQLAAVNDSFTLTERVGLASKKTDEKRKQVAELETAMVKCHSAIKGKAEEWKIMQAETERVLVKFLSESDVEYQAGANVKVFYRSLRKNLTDFHHIIREFLKALGQARVAMSAQYNKETKLFHVNAQDRFNEAAAFAQQMDEGILEFNHLADGHAGEVKQTYLNHITLPRLTELSAQQSVESIRQMEISPAHQRIEQTIAELEQLCSHELPALEAQILAADTEHDETNTRYVERYWEQLRQQVWRDMHQGITHAPFAGKTTLHLRPSSDADSSENRSE